MLVTAGIAAALEEGLKRVGNTLVFLRVAVVDAHATRTELVSDE